MDALGILRVHVDIVPYLNLETTKALSRVSKSSLNLVESHLTSHYFFSPLTSLVFYKNARKINISLDNYPNPKYSNLCELFPEATHLKVKTKKQITNPTYPYGLSSKPLFSPKTKQEIPPSKTLDHHQHFPLYILPPKLTHLEMDSFVRVNLPPHHQLKYLKYIVLYETLDEIPSNIFQNITHLVIGMNFNDNLSVNSNLPRGISHLDFTYKNYENKFNKPFNFLISSGITTLILPPNFSQPLDNLPQNLKRLTVGSHFHQSVANLPQFLTHLKFSVSTDWAEGYYYSLDKLPQGLTHLFFERPYHGRQISKFPPTLKIFKFRTRQQFLDRLCNLPHTLCKFLFDPDISTQINFPQNIKWLYFGDHFNEPIDNLPPHLIHLQFGAAFNQKIDNLPHTITHLKFGLHFSQRIDRLPFSLTHLSLASSRFCPVQFDALPPNVISLQLSDLANSPIHKLPMKVSHLVFGKHFNQLLDNCLPLSLTHLEFGYYFNKPVDSLPPNITHLTFGTCFDKTVKSWPSCLKYLTFGNTFNQFVENLPPTLTKLTFGESFNKPVEKLPPSLKTLEFSSSFNNQVDNLPPNLENLIFGNDFDRKVDHLPISLLHLKFGGNFNQKVDKLPPNILTLHFGFKFNQPVNHLPFGIFEIEFGESFSQQITNIPSSVGHLHFKSKVSVEDVYYKTLFPNLVKW